MNVFLKISLVLHNESFTRLSLLPVGEKTSSRILEAHEPPLACVGDHGCPEDELVVKKIDRMPDHLLLVEGSQLLVALVRTFS